ncbi:ABC transporter transmembrane domain-containing protein [Sphingomonas sp. NY01]|uniref:ABC transporter transmembrane domain-containing protein n=1 Tax=Sphingomonas sp. NY01 TaxID=2968057 RepID=UPI00315D980D
MAFAGLAVISMVTSWVRSLVLIRLGTSLSYQVTVNLFRHLLRLPLPWFERRHVGDIVSRFGSTKPISDILSQGLIASLVDGIMALLTLGLMFLYSPALAALAVLALALTVGLRFAFFSVLKQANIDLIAASARESSAFIETIRGAATIKAFGEEGNRQRLWQQMKADVANAEIKAGRITAGFTAGEELVLSLERVLFVYIAIRFAMNGTLSLGMIFALQAYRQQFIAAGTSLLQQAVSFRLLDMHLSRIGDIALSHPEALSPPRGLIAPADHRDPVSIELRNVRFRYAPHEPEIIRGINLRIAPGEMIALVGASGGARRR